MSTEPTGTQTNAPAKAGEGLLATAGKAVVFSVVGFTTYRILEYLFKKPEQPIVVVLEDERCVDVEAQG